MLARNPLFCQVGVDTVVTINMSLQQLVMTAIFATTDKMQCTCRQKRRLPRRQQKPKLLLLLHLLEQLLQQLLCHLLPSLHLLRHLLLTQLLQWQATPLYLPGCHLLLPKQTTGTALLHPRGLRATWPRPPQGSCQEGSSRLKGGLSAQGRRLLRPSQGDNKVTQDQVCMSQVSQGFDALTAVLLS